MSSSRTINSLLQKVLALILLFTMSSCGLSLPTVTWPTATPDVLDVTVQNTLEAAGIITANSSAECPDYSPINGSANTGYNPDTKVCYYTLTASGTETVAGSVNPGGSFNKFDPNWTGLPTNPPSDDEVLKAFGLTRDMLQMFKRESASWEPALWVLEFKPEYYGKVNLNMTENGYQVTVDSVNYGVITFYTDDPAVTAVLTEHGLSIRWMPAYLASDAGKRLADPALLVALENHFGRCYHNPNSGRADVPYFGRVGPYQTWPGNVYPAWTPPGLDETVVHNNMEAVAMLGGMLEGWTIENGNAAWTNPDKGNPGATAQVHYWQEFCIPALSHGYVEIWLEAGQVGPGGTEVTTKGPYKFYADDLRYLIDGFHAVERMTYHSKND